MKKILIALLAVLLSTAVLAAGCGKKSESAGAKAILEKTQAASEKIKSLKANGEAVMSTPQSEVKETRMAFDMESNIISRSDVELRMTSTDESGARSDVYVVDGWAYTYSAGTGWIKQKVENAEELGAGALMTPGQVSEISKFAEKLEQLPDEGDNYVISFEVGTRFFEQALEGAEGSGMDEETMEAAKALMKGIEMSMVLKVDKNTYFPSETTVKMSTAALPMLGEADVSLKMTFLDYNQPVTVALPAEAQSARELPGGMPGGLPIPGLGF